MTINLIWESLNLNMLFSLLMAAFIARISIPPIVRVAKMKKLVAEPNGRTSHNGHIPYLGGIAIFASLAISTSLFISQESSQTFQYIVPAILVVFFIGLKDDIVSIRPLTKLAGQVIASLIIILLADVRVLSFRGLLGITELPEYLSIIFSLLVFIALINAFNLVDGIDGLAAGLGIQISLFFGIWLALLGQNDFAVLAFALAGGLMSFYYYNVFGKKYKLFMGDTGSLLIGLVIAILAIKIVCCEGSDNEALNFNAIPMVVVAALIIPIVDILRLFVLRIAQGKSPMHADKCHFHHYLLNLGLSHWQASSLIISINILIFVLALLLRNWDNLFLGILVLTLGICATVVPVFIAKIRKKP